MDFVFEREGLYKAATAATPLLNLLPPAALPFRLRFPRKPFHQQIHDDDK